MGNQFHVDKLSSAHIYLRMAEGDSWESIPSDLLTDLGQLTKANSIEGNKKDNITVIYTPWSNLKKDGSMAVGQVSFKDQRKVKRILIAQRENAIVNRLNKTRVETTQPDLFQEKEEHLRQLRKREQIARQERVRFFPFLFSLFCLLFLFLLLLASSYIYGFHTAMNHHQLIDSLSYPPPVMCARAWSTANTLRPSPQKKEEAKIAKERSEKKWQKDHAYDDLFSEENMEASSNQNRPENWEEDFM